MNIREALERVAGLPRNQQIDAVANLVKDDPRQLAAQDERFIHKQKRLSLILDMK